MFKKLSFLFVFVTFSIFAANFHISTPALLYGPGFVATTENISSMNINAAGLYRILYTEFIINFDSSYSFNYIGVGHFFKKFGNLGLSFFNNTEETNQTITFGYGKKLWKFLIFGFNIQYIHSSELNEMSFNPGILLYFKMHHTFRKLSIGFSPVNWLNRTSLAEYNLALSGTFKKRYGRTFIYTLGANFDNSFHYKKISFNTEFELFRYFFLNLGLQNNAILIGNSLKMRRDALYAGLYVNYNENNMTGSISYRRLIESPPKKLKKYHRRKTYKKRKKNKLSRKKIKQTPQKKKQIFEITDEDKLQQRELLEQGISLYSQDKLYDALKLWKKVLTISETTEYADQARGYIELVTNELKKIKGK